MVSIIVPFQIKKEYTKLLLLLSSIAKSNFDLNKIEVILVNDHSDNRVVNDIKLKLKNYKYKIRLISNPGAKGPGIARNCGLKVAKGDIIAFTDSDCQVDANWLRTLTDHLSSNRKEIIGGEVITDKNIIFPWKMAPAGSVKITANLAYSRSSLPTLFFDEDFKDYWGSDSDFVIRAEASGVTYRYLKNMRIYHPVNIFSLKHLVRKALARRNEVLIYKKHKEKAAWMFNTFLFRPLLFQRISPITTLIIIGMIISLNTRPIHIIGIMIIYALILIVVIPVFTEVKKFKTKMSLKERAKTIIYLHIWILFSLIGRLYGSIRFKYLLL